MQIEWFLVHMFNIPVVPICIPGLQKTFPGEHPYSLLQWISSGMWDLFLPDCFKYFCWALCLEVEKKILSTTDISSVGK